MGVDFEWQMDQELPPERAERPAKPPRSPNFVRLMVIGTAALALVVVAGVFWVRMRQRKLAEVESAVAAVARLELQSLADGDLDLYLSLQYDQDGTWLAVQEDRARSGNAFPPPLPSLTATGVFTVGEARVVGDWARVEVVRTAYLKEGEVGRFRAVRFYRRAPDGRWLHAAVEPDYAGHVVTFSGRNIEVVVYDRDRELVEPFVPALDELAGRLCAQINCRNFRPRRVSLTGSLSNLVESDVIVPAPFLVGVPDDEVARAFWREALQETVLNGLLAAANVSPQATTGLLLYDQLHARLWGRLGLADPVATDLEFLRDSLAQRWWLPLWSLLWQRSPSAERLAVEEMSLFLDFVEEEYGTEATVKMLSALSHSDDVWGALWQAFGAVDFWDITARFDEYVRQTVGVETAPLPRVAPFSGYDLVARCRAGSAPSLWGIDVTEGVTVPLTALPTGLHLHSWSPDGRYLLGMRERIFGGGAYLLPADGSPARRVEAVTARMSPGDWSPDGRYLAYTVFDRPQDWRLVDVEQGTVLTITGQMLGWSPDGGHVAYVAPGSSGHDVLWLAAEDGSAPRPVGEAGSGAGWSPDGRQLAVYGRSSDGACLWRYDLDTETTQPIVDCSTADALLGFDAARGQVVPQAVFWSPDGEWIAVSVLQAQYESPVGFRTGTFLVRPDGSGLHLLADAAGGQTPIGWSPDGAYLALLSYDGMGEALTTTVMTPAGEVLFEEPGRGTWSPDGAYLAIVSGIAPLRVWEAATGEMGDGFGLRCDNAVWNPGRGEGRR